MLDGLLVSLKYGFDGNLDTLANANSAGGTMTFTPNLGSGPFAVEIKFGNDQLYNNENRRESLRPNWQWINSWILGCCLIQ